MTVNHKIEVELKSNTKETLERNKEKIKIGVCCLVIGGIYGYSKGIKTASKIFVEAMNEATKAIEKINS